MPTELRPVETSEEVLTSLDTFNEEAVGSTDRSRRILRSTQYWVYDPDTGRFGPGKFVGYRGMTFDLYEQGNQGDTTGAKFDGHVSKNAIETALGDSFEPNPDLHTLLTDWGTAIMGADAFGGADSAKWKFVALEVAAQDAEEGENDQPSKARNPNWQRDELILALDLYVRYAGKPPSHTHPDIVELSRVLNALPIHSNRGDNHTFRNENGVYLKLMNFRRFDPNQEGVGMTRGNKLEKEVWEQYADKPDLLRQIADRIRAGYQLLDDEAGVDPEEEAFAEGRVLYRLHRMRERNKAVIQKAKTLAKKKHGRLFCTVCKFDFAKTYGPLGEDYIEGHHTKPVSELTADSQTKASDIALQGEVAGRVLSTGARCTGCDGTKNRGQRLTPHFPLVADCKSGRIGTVGQFVRQAYQPRKTPRNSVR